ncbi:MAG: glycosyltransferase [Pseudomonadota bacterium]
MATGQDGADGPVRIAILICTRRRPEGLLACLASLDRADKPAQIAPCVIVVENEETPTDLADRLADAGLGLPVRHVREPRLGIPMARNRTLDEAMADAPGWVLFLDDDEEVGSDYFHGLAGAMTTHDADVITGPVLMDLAGPRPPWMPVDKPHRWAEGAVLQSAATGNTLAARCLFSEDGLGLRFDETLAFTGGSDVELFHRAVAAGVVIRWSTAFPAHETWGPERLKMRWHLRRKYREASVGLMIERDASARRRMIVGKAIKGPVEALGYGLAALLALPVSRARSSRFGYRALAKLWEAGAILGALTGQIQQPYRKIDE